MFRVGIVAIVILGALGLLGSSGCNLPIGQIQDLLTQAEAAVNRTIDNVQDQDPRTVTNRPVDSGGEAEVSIDPEAEFVDDVSEDLTAEELGEIILLAFENQTGYDIYLAYTIDGEDQEAFIFNGQAVPLAYPCFIELAILSEMDFDISTGDFVAEFTFQDTVARDGENFTCGDLFAVTITPEGATGNVDVIDLSTGEEDFTGDFEGEPGTGDSSSS